MKKIYEKDGFTLEVDTESGEAILRKPGKRNDARLGDLSKDFPKSIAEAIRKAGKTTSEYLFIRGGYILPIGAKDAWDAALEEYKINRDKKASEDEIKRQEDNKKLHDNVPGIDILEDAYATILAHADIVDKAFYSENGVTSLLTKPNINIKELESKYPKAKAYLKAKKYTHSSNADKDVAGRRAMNIMKDGGSIEDAEKVLQNWAPFDAAWR